MNRALESYGVLVGEWTTVGRHPMFPDTTFHGTASCDWFEGGAFLIMRTHMDEPEIPDGISIFGTDGNRGTHHMLYFDVRGVSRRYEVEVLEDGFRWSRDDPEFAQVFTLKVLDSGSEMIGEGQMRRGGSEWETDLAMRYTRAR